MTVIDHIGDDAVAHDTGVLPDEIKETDGEGFHRNPSEDWAALQWFVTSRLLEQTAIVNIDGAAAPMLSKETTLECEMASCELMNSPTTPENISRSDRPAAHEATRAGPHGVADP